MIYESVNVLYRAINVYGKKAQLDMAIEEMTELTKEICKLKRGQENIENIIEEIADVEIMLMQLRIIFDISDPQFFKQVNKKTERLKERLDEDLKKEWKEIKESE